MSNNTHITSPSWFKNPHEESKKKNMIATLKNFILIEHDEYNKNILLKALETISKILLNYKKDIQDIMPCNLKQSLSNMQIDHKQDFLVMAIIICLFTTKNHGNRLQILIDNWSSEFIVIESLLPSLKAIVKKDIETIRLSNFIGEGFQNKISRENGIKWLGKKEHDRQMQMMKNGVSYPEIKDKYNFLNKIKISTLGGSFCKMVRYCKLSLPGEPYGFAEFFLWHDLMHLLSGNNTDYPGELGANAFTAACSKHAKYQILIWGLLQFNLGYSLAVVAHPGKDQLQNENSFENYCHSILNGSKSLLDVLDWELPQLMEDLKADISVIRKKYNITPLS
jgi:hypothetical protein